MSSDAEDPGAEKDYQALTVMRSKSDEPGVEECRLLVAGRKVPSSSCAAELRLCFSLDGRRFELSAPGEPWLPQRCQHISTIMAWSTYLDLLSSTWGPKLQALPYVVAGKELRSALLQRLPLRADEDVFHDVTVWLDRFQVDVTQAGYFSQSREEIPERKRKYLEGRSRTTRETLEAENRRTFPMKSKSLDIPAFRFKPIQVGV